MKVAAALLLAFVVGASARWFDIPSPAPPKLIGALLVAAMTLGYVTVDALLARRAAESGSAAPAATDENA